MISLLLWIGIVLGVIQLLFYNPSRP